MGCNCRRKRTGIFYYTKQKAQFVKAPERKDINEVETELKEEQKDERTN